MKKMILPIVLALIVLIALLAMLIPQKTVSFERKITNPVSYVIVEQDVNPIQIAQARQQARDTEIQAARSATYPSEEGVIITFDGYNWRRKDNPRD